jgi:hypothetical protein
MDQQFGHSEKFYMRLVDDNESSDVCLDLSIDGLRVLDRSGGRTKRKIPLDHITRWTRSHDRVTMFVKTPVDIEEKPVSFYGSGSALSSLLDTLTSFCLQCAHRHLLLSLLKPRGRAHASADLSGPFVLATAWAEEQQLCRLVEIMDAKQDQERANEMRAVARNGGRRHKEVSSV